MEYETRTIEGHLATIWYGQGERSDGLSIVGPDVFVFPPKYCRCLTCGQVWDRYEALVKPAPPHPNTICGAPEGYRKHHRFVLENRSPWCRGLDVSFSNGDQLTIYDPQNPQTTLWSGEVIVESRLRQMGKRLKHWKYHILEGATEADRKNWFENHYPAKLRYSRRIRDQDLYHYSDPWRRAVTRLKR